jgi:hypothetical protein
MKLDRLTQDNKDRMKQLNKKKKVNSVEWLNQAVVEEEE